MHCLGITAEYNPIHNGHIYHLQTARRLNGADFVVVLMSGDFVQRGQAAISDKWKRSKAAIEAGADLVIELPFLWATQSAEIFASGAIACFKALGCVDSISFGVETDRPELLGELAELISNKRTQVQNTITEELKTGISYASAKQKAIEILFSDQYAELLASPNNTLALEYILADINTEGKRLMNYLPVTRLAGIHASDIRAEMYQNNQEYFDQIEEKMWTALASIVLGNTNENLATFSGVKEGFENRIKSMVTKAKNYREYVSLLDTKRYTRTNIERTLLHILANYKNSDFVQPSKAEYLRVLAMNHKGRELLRRIKKQELNTAPIITNVNKEFNTLSDVGRHMILFDFRAADLYNLLHGNNLYQFSDKVVMPFIK